MFFGGVRMKAAYRFGILTLVLLGFAHASNAVTVTFDGATDGVTTFGFDADGDTVDDAVFSSLTGQPFTVSGPGPNQLFIQEPGLVAFIVADPDPEVRVEFPNGAATSAGYSFALSVPCDSAGPVDPSLFGSIEVFDAADNSLGFASAEPVCTVTPDPSGYSSFVEAEVSVTFSGLASYAIIDFGPVSADAFIVDNFNYEGRFGSTEPVPSMPISLLLLTMLMLGGLAYRHYLPKRSPAP